MWLINTQTLELEFFEDAGTTAYAILSHTWETGEVSFQDFKEPEIARHKKGYQKILKTCQLALHYDPPLPYCWVDTCCIDKTSSAELSEAINSMYRWYKESAICFVFLADFLYTPSGVKSQVHSTFSQCRWFTRGWTLQELIAPPDMLFWDMNWNFFGSKKDLLHRLSEITAIPIEVLEDSTAAQDVCVAQRMSWAAQRQTTRVEDQAYCLLGIFGVYMTMLYGEGQNAFIRLQEEIIKNSSDLSIFGWESPDGADLVRGIFAKSPSEFAGCTGFTLYRANPVVVRGKYNAALTSQEFGLTNRGVRFSVCLSQLKSVSVLVLGLGCNDYYYGDENTRDGEVGISLLKSLDHELVRLNPSATINLYEHEHEPLQDLSPFYVAKTLSERQIRRLLEQYQRSILVRWTGEAPIINSAGPLGFWDVGNRLFLSSGEHRTFGFIYFSYPARQTQCTEFFLVCALLHERAVCQLWSPNSRRWKMLMDYAKHPEKASSWTIWMYQSTKLRTATCTYGNICITATASATDESVVGEPQRSKFRVDISLLPREDAMASDNGGLARILHPDTMATMIANNSSTSVSIP